MIWLITLGIFTVIICWLLFSSIILEIDTRIPQAGFRWVTIGNAWIWYDKEWQLSFRILFFHKTILFSEIKPKPKRITKVKVKRKRKGGTARLLKKVKRALQTFHVEKWQLAIDTGDHVRNAQLYPLNYTPWTFNHLNINFTGDNYLVLRIKNRPWRIIYAFLK